MNRRVGPVGKPTSAGSHFEAAIISLILRDPSLVARVREQIRVSDFSDSGYQVIFREILQMALQHKPIDVLTLAQHLDDRKLLAEVGGPTALDVLRQDTPVAPENLNYYTKCLIERSVRRDLHAQTQDGCESEQLRQILTSAQARLSALQSQGSSPLLDEMRAAVRRLDILSVPSTEPALLSPFWSAQEGDQIILSGKRAAGKTTLATDIAVAAVLPCLRGLALGGLLRWNLELLANRRIAILDGENSSRRWESLIRRLLEHRGLLNEENSRLVRERIIYLHAKDLGIRNVAEWTVRSEMVPLVLESENAAFYLLDSTGRFWAATNLSEMEWVQRGLSPLAEACKATSPPISGLVLAHTRRSSAQDPSPVDPLGSSTQENYTDGLINISRDGDSGISLRHEKNRRAWWISSGATVEINWPKNKLGFEPTGNWATTWSHESPDAVAVADDDSTRTRLLRAIREAGSAGARTKDLAATMGISDRQVRRHLDQLEAASKIKRPHRGLAVATDAAIQSEPRLQSIGVGPKCPNPATSSTAEAFVAAEVADSSPESPVSDSVSADATTSSGPADAAQTRSVRSARPKE